MKLSLITAVVPLLLTMAAIAPLRGDGPPDPEPDVLDVLSAGQHEKLLPKGVVIRVEANLWRSVPADKNRRAEEERRGVDFADELYELWEFSADQIHQVVVESPAGQPGKRVYRRVQSLPFVSEHLCRDLIAGNIEAIAAADGEGEPLQFAGTDFDLGSRSIEILIDGESALVVGESCADAGYAESDALAFAALYERLATQARAAFSVGPRKSNR